MQNKCDQQFSFYIAQVVYLVVVQLCVVELYLVCMEVRALHEWVRGTGWSVVKVLVKYPHPYLLQVAGAGEEYSPPPRPHHLHKPEVSDHFLSTL